MTKNEWRQHFLAKRNALSHKDVLAKSQIISQTFFTTFDLNLTYLHLFLPILKKNEVNTWLIIENIQKNYQHLRLIVPKSQLTTGQMTSYFLEKDTPIVENHWHIPEPVEAVACPNDLIDMVLIPLLCFDQQGFRVGYGKGFYDRFLSQCRPDVIKIGLSFFAPVDCIDDLHPYDIRMDYCIQENQVFHFKSVNLEKVML